MNTDIPDVFKRISQSRGQEFDPSQVTVTVIDGVARNVFSPESHAKGFQGLDMLMLVFGRIDSEDDVNELREELENQFRDRWVARARIFTDDARRWVVSTSGDDALKWNP